MADDLRLGRLGRRLGRRRGQHRPWSHAALHRRNRPFHDAAAVAAAAELGVVLVQPHLTSLNQAKLMLRVAGSGQEGDRGGVRFATGDCAAVQRRVCGTS